MTQAAGQLPPHDAQTEREMLSAIMLEQDRLAEVDHVAPPSTMYDERNRLAYQALCEVIALGKTPSESVPTMVHVAQHLREAGLAQRVPSTYLAEVAEAPYVAPSRLVAHAKRLRSLWQARQMISRAQAIAAAGYSMRGEAEIEAYLSESQQSIHEICEDAQGRSMVPIRVAIADYVAIATDESKRAATRGILTGNADLDRRTAYKPGALSIVAARPGAGKSALAASIMLGVARSGTIDGQRSGSLALVLEMPTSEVVARMLGSEARIDVGKMMRGEMRDDDWGGMVGPAQVLSDLPIVIDDSTDLSIGKLRTKIRLARTILSRQDAALRLVVIDYLQLMTATRRQGGSREQEVSEISRQLKLMSKDESVHIMVLAQLNRGCEQRSPPRPQLSDIRESGGPEQDADMVLLMYRADMYSKRHPEEAERMRGLVEIIVAKQRGGPAGCSVIMRFIDRYTRFEQADFQHDPEAFDL